VEAQARAELGGNPLAADETNSRVEGRRVWIAGNPQALAPRIAHNLNGVLDESPCDTSSLPPRVDEQVIQLRLTDIAHGHRGEAKDRSYALESGHRNAGAPLSDAFTSEMEELGASQQQWTVS
jgi:hypothetical protein